MQTMNLEEEIKQLIISTLHLEGLEPGAIDSNEALFGEGLGLDSIDGLELGIALRKTYGLKIESANEELRAHFATVAALASFVAANRGDA